ncbi:protein PSK SIMULATOR 3-like [Rutidosis leptorrhynchoides]|uniref:protein PSK SIMULATOR 3-like n=1 Tax=Rutidosis leptorrhynchoides TaxID=125765 RepID=UPI003A998010
MVAEPWLPKMKKLTKTNKQNHTKPPETIGILSFEIANLMSKSIRLYKSLTNSAIFTLKTQVLTSEGIKTLISSDETYLLDLTFSEKLDELNSIAHVVSRLGHKCTIPQLQGFQHVYKDIINGAINVMELSFLVKDMDSMVRKMERFVNSTCSLYGEMMVMNELEIATKKFQQNRHEGSRKVFEQKLMWQIEDVKRLKHVSLWNQTYDKIVEMLVRTVCTVYARICFVFVDSISRREMFCSNSSRCGSVTSLKLSTCKSLAPKSDQIVGSCSSSVSIRTTEKEDTNLDKFQDFNYSCGLGPKRLIMECLSISSSVSKLDHHDYDNGSVSSVPVSKDRSSSHISAHSRLSHTRAPLSVNQKGYKSANSIKSFRNVAQAPANSVGGSALELQYANIVIVIEKLLQYPHIVGEEARDDLYQMLPKILRLQLKRSLKSYIKDIAIYDAPIAHDWKDKLDGILAWFAPMAHNMIRWQNERNYEQQNIVSKQTNVLLLQTLYFADREKTEAAICELLVGLNYICRYEHQQNALLDCGSSFDLDDGTNWEMEY